MTLCSNRPEGFGPRSALHPLLPTTCFLDVVVAPLATWIFLFLALLILTPLRIVKRRNSTSLPADYAFKPDASETSKEMGMNGGVHTGDEHDPVAENNVYDYSNQHQYQTTVSTGAAPSGLAGTAPDARGRRRRLLVLEVLYYVLVVAMVAMVSLEIARLVAGDLGVGLLPFTYAGLILAAVHRSTVFARWGRRWACKAARALNVLYWLMLTAAFALKTAAEQLEQMDNAPGVRRAKDAGNGAPDNYPTSDEALDNAVMAGVVLVLAMLESFGWSGLSWL